MEDLIKGELDWHNKVNSNFHEVDSQMADNVNIKQYQFLVTNWQETNADWTSALQTAIDNLPKNATLLIPDKMIIYASTVTLKSNIKIKCLGQIIQNTQAELETFNTTNKQISTHMLFEGRNVENVLLELNTISNYESIHFYQSHDIYIKNTKVDGNRSVSDFPGISFQECYDYSIKDTEVQNCGTERTEIAHYTNGAGIRNLICHDFDIKDCYIHNNGENGIYTFGCYNFDLFFNKSINNGMSGTQIAFGGGKTEKNINIGFNKFYNNCADGLDINNSFGAQFDVNMNIFKNINYENGFVNGESSPDGSGIATLMNLSNVHVENNVSFNNNHVCLYSTNNSNLYIIGNIGDSAQFVGVNKDIYFIENNMSIIVNFTSARRFIIEKSTINELSIPTGVTIDQLCIENCTINKFENVQVITNEPIYIKNCIITNTHNLNINVAVPVIMSGNIITCTDKNIVWFSPVRGSVFINNTVQSPSDTNSFQTVHSGFLKIYNIKNLSGIIDTASVAVISRYNNIYMSTPPTAGAWSKNEEVTNNNQVEQGTSGSKYVITGWHCNVAGTPGTWSERRTLTGN